MLFVLQESLAVKVAFAEARSQHDGDEGRLARDVLALAARVNQIEDVLADIIAATVTAETVEARSRLPGQIIAAAKPALAP